MIWQVKSMDKWLAREVLFDPRMTMCRLLLLAPVAILVAACESGWDVDGQVLTAAAPEKNRPLYVFLVDAKTIEPETLRSGAMTFFYQQTATADAIPPEAIPFQVSEFGCHAGSIAIVAWAPRAPAPPDQVLSARVQFQPQSGDYVAYSDVRHPYCGMYSRPEHIDLVLDGQTYPPP